MSIEAWPVTEFPVTEGEGPENVKHFAGPFGQSRAPPVGGPNTSKWKEGFSMEAGSHPTPGLDVLGAKALRTLRGCSAVNNTTGLQRISQKVSSLFRDYGGQV